MFKKLLTLALALMPMFGFAQHRSESEAISVAQEFWGNKVNRARLNAVSQNSIAQAKTRTMQNISSERVNSKQSYYVINDEEHNRFVIVSADDRMYKILGYSDRGCFNSESVPPGLLDILAGYDEAYTDCYMVLDQKRGYDEPQDVIEPIEPLIKTHWGQGYPYNLECPEILDYQCETGCGATALAQILNYYRFSPNGKGSHSYKTRNFFLPLSLNFENLNIDWNKLSCDYDETSTEEECKEVAKLMYACGVSLSMDYGILASSIQSNGVAYPLKHFWGYNPNISYIERNYNYDINDIQTIINRELKLGHPVLVDLISSDNEGHEAIIDGIDENQLLHYNFGWEGYADGYYRLKSFFCAGYLFNSGNYTINIATEIYGEKDYDFILGKGEMSDIPSSVNLGDSLHISVSIRCVSPDVPKSYMNIKEGLDAEVGLALFDSQFKPVYTYSSGKAMFLSDMVAQISGDICIESNLFVEGKTFYFAPYYTFDGETFNVPIAEIGYHELYSVTVQDGVASFTPTKIKDISTAIQDVVLDKSAIDECIEVKANPSGFDIISKIDTILQIYSINGRLIFNCPLKANSQKSVCLQEGIYIINGKKYSNIK